MALGVGVSMRSAPRPSLQGHAWLLHLLGARIVGSHSEAFWVNIQKLSDLKEVFGLPGASGTATQGLKATSLY